MLRPAWYATAAAVVLAMPAEAQTEAVAPPDYALINARIIVAPGRVIERGTIRVTDGRIAAVGDRVTLPAGVVQFDAAGRNIYPGLIDAATTTGLPRVMPQGGGRGGGPEPAGAQQAAQPSQGRQQPPPQVRPGQMAADVFAPSESELEAYRAAGVTTLGLAFESGGIFPGQTAAVGTGSADAAELVLRTPVSLQVTFGRRLGAYPGTLMGTIAYIKQAFHDAAYDARATEAFEGSPSAPRPSYDAEHRALAPAAAGSLPVWFTGSTERELERVTSLAAELGVQNYTIVGAQEGWKVADLLKSAARPVIVSLDFPAPNAVTGRAFDLHVAPASGEDTVAEEADSAAARAARGNAAALASAGVPFALASYGGAAGDFRTAILAAVEAGLAPDDALRALTETPARVLGIDGVAGSIEPGKLANLVVVEGDLFSDSGRVREVIVEGERFELSEPARRGGRGGGRGDATGEDAGEAPRVAGEWAGSMESPGGTFPFTLNLSLDDSALTGTLASEMGTVALSGELNDQDVVLTGTATPPGMNAMDITISGTITGDDLSGTIAVQGMADTPFSARRRGPGQNTHTIHGGGQ